MDRCDIIALRRSSPNRIRVQGAGCKVQRPPLRAASCIKGAGHDSIYSHNTLSSWTGVEKKKETGMEKRGKERLPGFLSLSGRVFPFQPFLPSPSSALSSPLLSVAIVRSD